MEPMIDTQPTRTTRDAPHHRFVPVKRLGRGLQPTPAPGTRSGSLFEGEPEQCRRDWVTFMMIWTMAVLLWSVVRVYHVEGRGLLILMGLAAGALPLHYLAPFRWKKPLFLALSVVGMASVFGLATSIAVSVLGAILLGITALPISWTKRAGILAATTLGLAAGRAEWIPVLTRAVPPTAWPLLGSIFMFRLMIYMYELKHAKKRESLVDTVGYFCMLPNFCFLLFPVIDYRAYQRGYFATDIHEIQRRGLRMIFRGIVHLLLYRIIYHEVLITPEDVQGPATLASFLVFNYLLYLRVSGQFHIACGLLHLYGFQLPDTHHHYLLATGFTDYWRRINIYWKDFMVRMVFNPVVFRLKKWPQSSALAVATTLVFLVTWLLHAYQTFWLKGHWGFTAADALFWGILGTLVLVNVQFDARSQRRKSARARSGRWLQSSDLAIQAVKILGTFCTIALLWSLWSSPSVSAWLAMMARGLGLAGLGAAP